MPHKCARCGKIYDDNSKELINGCTCGSRVFLYLKGNSKKKKEVIEKLKQKEVRETDLEWLEKEFGDKLKRNTIHLDVENLERFGEGKFRLNIASLMSGEPLVVKARDGVYYIDISYAMKPRKKKWE